MLQQRTFVVLGFKCIDICNGLVNVLLWLVPYEHLGLGLALGGRITRGSS